MEKRGSIAMVVLVYLAAVLIGIEVASGIQNPITFVLTADVVATLVVFAFSHWYRNASTYDPYWSVIPVLIVLYWMLGSEVGTTVIMRQVLVVVLVCLWGIRLTWNWILRWRGLGDEDWRFIMLRKKHGRHYWLVNLGGIHMLPTLLVFLGCLATWPAIADSSNDMNVLDGLALLLTGTAIWIETRADQQLRAHRLKNDGSTHNSGWWARCRHPNYLGEVLFWWGLYLFALAANPAWWWTGIGALAINLLFVLISIPMMDEHMQSRYAGYHKRMQALPALLPRISRKV